MHTAAEFPRSRSRRPLLDHRTRESIAPNSPEPNSDPRIGRHRSIHLRRRPKSYTILLCQDIPKLDEPVPSRLPSTRKMGAILLSPTSLARRACTGDMAASYPSTRFAPATLRNRHRTRPCLWRTGHVCRRHSRCSPHGHPRGQSVESACDEHPGHVRGRVSSPISIFQRGC